MARSNTPRPAGRLGLALGALLVALARGQAQAPGPEDAGSRGPFLPAAKGKPEVILPPRAQAGDRGDKKAGGKDGQGRGPDILPASYPRPPAPGLAVTLQDVLLLAGQANLDIVQANLVVARARAAAVAVGAQFLPNLSLGSTYTGHEGQIQRTEGTVVGVNRDALFAGLGTTFNINLADALFLPREARALVEAARAGEVRVTNDTLLRVAEAYFAVLRARRQVARLDEVLDFLTSEERSPLRGGSQGLLPLIKAFVRTGNALPSDQARVEADVVRRAEERARALQALRTASAELARLLHLSATVFLLPAEDYRWPLHVPGEAWSSCPIDELVAQGLRGRPELAQNQALLEAALARARAARLRPLVPNVVLNYSFGGFGGGPRTVPTPTGGTALGQSGVIADFDTRSDLEVGLVWRLEGLGIGNIARARLARLGIEQVQVEGLQLTDLVIAQLVQAQEQVERGRERVEIGYASLFDDRGRPTGAVYRSLLLNFTRIRGGQGLPLEVLDSTRRLSDVLDGYANSLSDYDAARFRLLVALGLPPVALLDPRCMPAPACQPGPTLHLPGPLPARDSETVAGKNDNGGPKKDGRAGG